MKKKWQQSKGSDLKRIDIDSAPLAHNHRKQDGIFPFKTRFLRSFRSKFFSLVFSSSIYPLCFAQASTTFTVSSTAINDPNGLSAGIHAVVAAGGGTVLFDPSLTGGIIALGSSLPAIASSSAPICINTATGPFITILGTAGAGPIFYVSPSSIASFNNLLLTQGSSIGGAGGGILSFAQEGGGGGGGGLGAGGAVFVDSNAAVSLNNIRFTENAARGGAGGVGSESYGAYGINGGGGGGGAFYAAAGGAGGTGVSDLAYGSVAQGGGGGGGGSLPGQDGFSLLQVPASPSAPNDISYFLSGTGGAGGGTGGGLGGGCQGVAASSTATVPPGLPGAGATASAIFCGGGGGGGAAALTGANSAGGVGGAGLDFGGGGGGGGSYFSTPAAGVVGGIGGFGGGGGGFGSSNGIGPSGTVIVSQFGGTGGFGAGGGGCSAGSIYGGGIAGGGGGGGAGLGGALFVRYPAAVTISYTDSAFAPSTLGFDSNIAVGGSGGGYGANGGIAAGSDIFVNAGSELVFSVDVPLSINTAIASDPQIFGSDLPVRIEGSSVVEFNGANTFSGGVLVKGSLAVSSDSNLGLTAVNNGLLTLENGTLQINNATFSTLRNVAIGAGGGTILSSSSFTSPVPEFLGTISSTGSGGALSIQGGPIAFGGTNTYLGNTNIGTGATLYILSSGALSSSSVFLEGAGAVLDFSSYNGTYSKNIDGNGTVLLETGVDLTLNGLCTYGGTTTIKEGSFLRIGQVGALSSNTQLFNAGTLDIKMTSGVLSPTAIQGIGQVIMDGTGGTLVLSTDDTYAGGTIFNAGIVQIPGASALGSGALTFNGGALELTNPFEGILGATTTVGSGGGTIILDSGVSSTASGNWAINGPLTLTGPGEIAFSSLTASGGGAVTIGKETTLRIDEIASLPSGSPLVDYGLLQLDISGTGTINNTISGTGSVEILSGVVSYAGSVTYSGTTTIDLGATLKVTTPASYPTASTLVNHSLLQFDLALPTTALTVPGAISGTGALELTEGTILLSGTNTYSGTTTVGVSGTLKIGKDSAIPSSSTIVDVGSLIFQNTSGTAMPGVITGAGTVSMNGTGGAVTLTAGNTYSGDTYANSGTLQIFNGAALGGGSLVFHGGTVELSDPFTGSLDRTTTLETVGTIQVDPGVVATYSAEISGAGSLVCQGGGTLRLSNTNSYGSTTSIAVDTTLGILQLDALPATTVVTNNGLLVFDVSASPANIPQLIQGSGVLQLASATPTNIYTIGNSSNSYTGGTIIDSCTLSLSSFTPIGSGPVGLIDDGTLHLTTGSYTTSREILVGTGGGNIFIDTAVSFNCSGPIRGSAGNSLTILGAGQMTYSGAGNFAGTTQIGDGSFLTATPFVLAGGSLGGPLRISQGSSLQGSGSVGALENLGQMTMAATDLIVVSGNYTQDPSATLQIGIQGTGESSQIVVGGTANLDGSLVVTAAPGAYAFGTTYTILTSVDCLTTSFADLTLPAIPELFITYYRDPYITLTVVSQSVLPEAHVHGHNPQQVLTNLQEIVHTPSSDLVSVINAMGSFTTDELTDAMNQLHPAPFGSFELLNAQTMSQLTSIFGRHSQESCCLHLNSPCSLTETSVWVSPLGYLYDQGKIGEQIGFDAKSMGLAAGFSVSYLGGLLLGVGGAYSSSSLDWHHNRGNGVIDKATAAIYGGYTRSLFSLDFSVLGSLDIVTASRAISFGTIDRHARHQRSGYDLTAHIGGGGDFGISPFSIRPFVNLDYLYFFQKGFTEHGANSLDLDVRGKRSNMLRSEAGLEVSASFSMGDKGCFSPLFFISGINECYFHKKHYIANFTGQTPTFAVRSFNKPITLLSPGAELSFVWGNGLSFATRYSCELNQTITVNKLDARFEWFF